MFPFKTTCPPGDQMSEIKHTSELDCQGMNCPLPVIKTRIAIEGLGAGDILKVITSDPGSQKDIPAFCRRNSHELLEARQEGQKFIFYLQKN